MSNTDEILERSRKTMDAMDALHKRQDERYEEERKATIELREMKEKRMEKYIKTTSVLTFSFSISSHTETNNSPNVVKNLCLDKNGDIKEGKDAGEMKVIATNCEHPDDFEWDFKFEKPFNIVRSYAIERLDELISDFIHQHGHDIFVLDQIDKVQVVFKEKKEENKNG